MKIVNVLVVDDSAFMRRAITLMLEQHPDIRVTATARSGEEAIEKAASLHPDVITMDVEMPGIGGLEAVRAIMAQQHVPIIMVSALTREGAEITFRALDLGAVDFIAKPDAAYVNITDVARDLVAKIRTFVGRQQRRSSSVAPRIARVTKVASPVPISRTKSFACVAIGTSTGGPVALSRTIPHLPAAFTLPVVIVQHMPLGFTRPLAERLDAQSPLRVVEMADGHVLAPGSVYIVPSGKQVAFRRTFAEVEAYLVDDDGGSFHVPSVDSMMSSIADMYGASSLAVILTGMGQDGVKGLRRIKESGGYVIGQSEETCVVYGMPRAAAKEGLVDRVAGLDDVPAILLELTSVRRHE